MNKKILIVRGDRKNAKALSFLLAGSGYHISTHCKAGEAIEAARHQRFDLAITDEALPENQPNLGLIAELKEAQPSLPVFLLAREQSLETVINCIRAGVTEVIHNPTDLRNVIQVTNSFLRRSGADAANDEVTWEDMLEVERMLESYLGAGSSNPGSSAADPAEIQELKEKLKAANQERDRISGDLASLMANFQRAQSLIEELKADNGHRSTETELNERIAKLDEREKSLKALSQKISLQKVEFETEMAELEAQKIELEEARKEVKDNLDANPAALYQLNREFETERAENKRRQAQLEDRIQELQDELEAARQQLESSAGEDEIRRLSNELQDAQDQIAEKDFIVKQRDRELEDLRSQLETGGPRAEELEQERRLIEIEKHKLQERLDRFELERRDFQDTSDKRQREIQVERRDAEISLREMQNAIKEEQLKLKVEQATLKEDMRQFEQARQNFQEDVQELQSKQAELRKMEAYLQQMEQTIKSGAASHQATLPKPDNAAMEPFTPSSISPAHQPLQSGPAAPAAPAFQAPENAGPAPAPEQAQPPRPAGTPEDPNSWSKPDFDKKSGRGPLRIGRRSSF